MYLPYTDDSTHQSPLDTKTRRTQGAQLTASAKTWSLAEVNTQQSLES